jgi:hypothetical protein
VTEVSSLQANIEILWDIFNYSSVPFHIQNWQNPRFLGKSARLARLFFPEALSLAHYGCKQ